VFCYALRHGYEDLCDKVAPLTVDLSTKTMLEHLNHSDFARWVCRYYRPSGVCPSYPKFQVLFRDGYVKKLPFVIVPDIYPDLHSCGKIDCGRWKEVYFSVALTIGTKLSNLTRFADVTKDMRKSLEVSCDKCNSRADEWIESADCIINIAPFSSCKY